MIRAFPFVGRWLRHRSRRYKQRMGRIDTPALQVSAWTCMDGLLFIIEQMQLSWVSASHRGHLMSLINASNCRPTPILNKLLSFLSVGTKQQSRLKYSHSLISISLRLAATAIVPEW